MAEMSSVHLDSPKVADAYFKAHKLPSQGVFFDMEMTTDVSTMEAFAEILSKNDHLQDINLVFYENRDLSLNVFKKFTQALNKQKGLKKLCINLRWCVQITDEFLEALANALPESLESFELWVNGCTRLTDDGFAHKMEHIANRCKNVQHFTLHHEGTSLTDHHHIGIQNLKSDRKMLTMRITGLGIDFHHTHPDLLVGAM